MKKSLIAICAVLCLTYANFAFACDYYVDQDKKSDELKTVALASFKSQNILSSTVTEFSTNVNRFVSMCPSERTFSAVVQVVFKTASNSSCYSEVLISKIESWKDDFESYTVTGKRATNCNK